LYIYIYQIKKIVIFSKYSVNNLWFDIYEKFGIFLSEGLVESSNQIIFYVAKREQRNHSGVETIY